MGPLNTSVSGCAAFAPPVLLPGMLTPPYLTFGGVSKLLRAPAPASFRELSSGVCPLPLPHLHPQTDGEVGTKSPACFSLRGKPAAPRFAADALDLGTGQARGPPRRPWLQGRLPLGAPLWSIPSDPTSLGLALPQFWKSQTCIVLLITKWKDGRGSEKGVCCLS